MVEPHTGLSMGQSCELMAKTWQIPRAEQDQLAFESHRKAAAAYDEGFFDDLVVEFRGLKRDNNVRRDTSLEKLATLKPSFDRQGTLTAGNSTPMTDGAAAVLLASEEWAKARGLPVLAYLTYGKYAAVDFVEKEGLLMAPAYAVPRMLADAGLKLQDFDFYEIHEAFEAQVLCTLKAWQSPEFCRDRLGLAQPLGTIDRSQDECEGRKRCDRTSVRRNRRAHPRDAGEAARDPRQRTRADFDLYGGRNGRDGDRREVTERAADSIRGAAYCGPDTADRRPGGCKGRSSLQPAAGSKRRDPGEGAVTIADPDTAGNSTTNLTGEPED